MQRSGKSWPDDVDGVFSRLNDDGRGKVAGGLDENWSRGGLADLNPSLTKCRRARARGIVREGCHAGEVLRLALPSEPVAPRW